MSSCRSLQLQSLIFQPAHPLAILPLPTLAPAVLDWPPGEAERLLAGSGVGAYASLHLSEAGAVWERLQPLVEAAAARWVAAWPAQHPRTLCLLTRRRYCRDSSAQHPSILPDDQPAWLQERGTSAQQPSILLA